MEPQLIPAGLLLTVPVPASATVSTNGPGGGGGGVLVPGADPPPQAVKSTDKDEMTRTETQIRNDWPEVIARDSYMIERLDVENTLGVGCICIL